MFRVEFFVDDKKLGKTLVALVGLAQFAPVVTPVINAVATKDGIAPIANGSATDRFAVELKKHKGKILKSSEFADMMKAIGVAPISRGYMLKNGVKSGLLKQVGKASNTRYTVI